MSLLFLISKLTNAQLIASFVGTPPSQPCTFDGTLCCVSISGIPGSGYTPVLPYECEITSGPPDVISTYNHPCFSGLTAGNYTIMITDAAGVHGSVYATVPASPFGLPPVITVTTVPAPCGGSTGSACALVSGGSGSGFTYSWQMFNAPYTSFGTSNCASGMPVGHYTLTIHDVGVPMCYYYKDVYIDYGPVTNISAEAHAATCTSPCNGYIEVDLSSATLPATVSWTGASSGSVSGITTSSYTITGLCLGSYNVTVDDASACAPVTISSLTIGLDNADLHISSCLVTWDPDYFGGQTDITLGGNLIIDAGACLLINDMTIRLTEGHQIQINPSGTLTSNNSTFDVGCNDPIWNGFSVLGVNNNACDAANQRGRLSLNQCTITHAENGVTNYNLNTSNDFGGNIHAVGSTWLNNIRDVTLRNFCPTTSGSVSDYSAFFEECNFLLTAVQSYTIDHYRIFLGAISDVRFRACNIRTTTPALYAPDGFAAYGVYATVSQFQWIGENNSEISGIARGIYSVGSFVNPTCSTGGFTTNDVTSTLFRCSTGVYFDLTTACNVLGNTLNLLPTGFTTSSYRGIQVQAPGTLPQTLFLIADNTINFTGTTAGISRIGITVDDTKGQSNYIFRNTVYNCAPGMKLSNRNRAAIVGQGLGGVHFECNVFHQCSKDINVVCNGPGCSTSSTGVAGLQANTFLNPGPSYNLSALNNFVNSINTAVRDDIDAGVDPSVGTITSFRYKYRAADYNATNYNSGSNVPLECSITTNPAPYNIVTPELQTGFLNLFYCEDKDYQIPAFPLIQQNLQSAKISYQNFKEVYNAIVDGGATEVLKANVLYANYTQALSVYEELMNQSPALSEEVMIAAITKEFDLPASLLTIILAANPSAAKNPEIWKAINNRNEPLDAYQRAQIMMGYYATSPKELLEEELGNYRAGIDHAVFEALQYFSDHPSASVFNTIRAMMADVNTYECDLLLAELEMQSGNFEVGEDLLLALPSKHKLSEDITTSAENLINIRQIHRDVMNRISHELTSDEIMFLQDLRDNDPCDLGNLAQIVLVTFSNEEMQELECLTERSMMSARQSHRKESKIQVYPNPTNSGWFVIKSSQPISNSEVFTLYDSSSRVILQATMKEKQQELFMDVSELSAGVYWIQSTNENFTPLQVVIQ